MLDSTDSRLASRLMYIDANKNGRRDSGERTARTSSNGTYTFSNLAAGTYRIRRADLPSGFKYSTPSSGYRDITVTSTQKVTTAHFGARPI